MEQYTNTNMYLLVDYTYKVINRKQTFFFFLKKKNFLDSLGGLVSVLIGASSSGTTTGPSVMSRVDSLKFTFGF